MHFIFHLKKELSKNQRDKSPFNSLDRINWQEDNNDRWNRCIPVAGERKSSIQARGTTYKVHLFDFLQTFFTELNKCV